MKSSRISGSRLVQIRACFPERWFSDASELIYFDGATYVIGSVWRRHVERYLRNIADAFPQYRIEVDPV